MDFKVQQIVAKSYLAKTLEITLSVAKFWSKKFSVSSRRARDVPTSMYSFFCFLFINITHSYNRLVITIIIAIFFVDVDVDAVHR